MKRILSQRFSLRSRLILIFAAILVVTYTYSVLSLYQSLALELPQISQQELSKQARELRLSLEQGLRQGQTLETAAQRVIHNVKPGLTVRVYTTGGQQITGAAPLAAEPVSLQTALAGQEEEKIVIDEKDQRYLLVALPLYQQKQIEGAIVAVSSLSIVDRLLDLVYPRLYVALIFSLIAVGGAGMYITANFTRVIREVEAVAREIAVGSFDRRMPIFSKDEIGQLAEAINHMAAELQRMSQGRKQFFSQVSHDLRTPLTIIKLTALTALREPVLPEQQRCLEIIDEQTDKLTHLVDDLLSLARLEAGKLELRQEEVDLAELMAEIIKGYQPQANQQGISLSFTVAELKDSTAWIDCALMSRVFQNLIDNALKHTSRGGAIELKLTEAADGNLQIIITDSGYGIPPENLPFIFEPFYKVDPLQKGTGLGLTIARELVQMHQGKISVESEKGVGASFTILLPRSNLFDSVDGS